MSIATNNNISKLAEELSNYAKSIVLGQLSGAFKHTAQQKNDVNILKNFKLVYPLFLMNYLNIVYVSLIKKDNQTVADQFTKLKSYHNHSEVCLIHFTRMLCSEFVNAMLFDTLDYVNYDTFMMSCTLQLNILAIESVKLLEGSLSHECKGIDISTCDPNEKLFYLK